MPISVLKEDLYYISNKILAVSSLVYSQSLNKVALIHRDKNPEYGLLTFPGGKTKRGEFYKDAAVRELLEETGYIVKFPEFHIIDFFSTEHYLIVVTLCEIIGQQIPLEENSIVWLSFDEIEKKNESEFTSGLVKIISKGKRLIDLQYNNKI